VVFERADDGGWGASEPDLSGIDAYAREQAELGRPLPVPIAGAGTIEAA
jgi:hypothetical protein